VEGIKRLFVFSLEHFPDEFVRKFFLNFRWCAFAFESFLFLRLVGFLDADPSHGACLFRRPGVFRAPIRLSTYSSQVMRALHAVRNASEFGGRRIALDWSLGSFAVAMFSDSIQLVIDAKDAQFCLKEFAKPLLPAFEMDLGAEHSISFPGRVTDLAPHLYPRFSELSLICVQIGLGTFRDELVMLYGLILHELRDGLSLTVLLDKFGPSCIPLLEALMQFGFIRRVSSFSAIPVFVGDLFAGPESLDSHCWVMLDGSVDPLKRDRILRSVYELVEHQPGIELQALLAAMRVISWSDLLEILTCLELDELIYRVCTTSVDTDLFSSSCEVLQSPSSDLLIGMELSQVLADPSSSRSFHHFFPTTRMPL
jgi:hypothetical protein